MADEISRKEPLIAAKDLLRELGIWVVIGAFVYKSLQFDLSSVQLTAVEFLALLLALFSVGLAVAFFFQSERSSNAFFRESQQHTARMSELLARVEAGLDTRIRHLSDNYDGLRLDLRERGAQPRPSMSPDPSRAPEFRSFDLSARLRSLVAGAGLSTEDVVSLLQGSGAPKLVADGVAWRADIVPMPLIRAILEAVVPALGPPGEVAAASPAALQARLDTVAASLPAEKVDAAIKCGVLESDGRLTDWGLAMVRGAAEADMNRRHAPE